MSEAVESVRDSLNAAFDQAERSAPPEPRAPRESRTESRTETSRNGENRVHIELEPDRDVDSSPESTDLSPEDHESRESGVDRPRDQFGRFARSTPPGEPSQPSQEQPSSDRAPGEDHELTDQPETDGGAEPARPAILPPQSWSAAARDIWTKLPRQVQEEVDRRERDVQRAFQQRAEQTNVLEPIAQAIQPYANKLALRGVHPAAAVQQLLAVQDILDNDPIAGVAHVAKVYGVDLRQFATAFSQAQQPQDPVVRELAERVARQEQTIQQWHQGAAAQQQARIDDEVQRFVADTTSHPYFEHVRLKMVDLMASEAAGSLDEAYRMACAADERVSAAIRQNELASAGAARTAAERQAAVRARRAAVSVTGTPGGMAPEGRGKSDTVRDAVRSALEQHGV